MSVHNKKTMVKWYNEYAKEKETSDDQIVSVSSLRYERITRDIEELISLMGLSDDEFVLDAGCGAGRFIYRIRKTCMHVSISFLIHL